MGRPDVHDAVVHAADTLTVDWWAAAPPDPVVEPAVAPSLYAAPGVDEAHFDAPDLHFGP